MRTLQDWYRDVNYDKKGQGNFTQNKPKFPGQGYAPASQAVGSPAHSPSAMAESLMNPAAAGSFAMPGLSSYSPTGSGLAPLARRRTAGEAGYRSSAQEPWLMPVFQAMVRTGQAAVSLTPFAELVIANSASPYIGYQSSAELYAAATAAVQGDPRKTFNQGTLGTAASFLGACSITNGTAATSAVVFGFRVRVAASQLNFVTKPFNVDIGPILNTAGVFTMPAPVIQWMVFPRRVPQDLVFLVPANAGGLMTVVPGAAAITATTVTSTLPGIAVYGAAADTNYLVTIESLNQRDLVARGSGASQYDGDLDVSYDEGNYGMGVFPGVRDQ